MSGASPPRPLLLREFGLEFRILFPLQCLGGPLRWLSLGWAFWSSQVVLLRFGLLQGRVPVSSIVWLCEGLIFGCSGCTSDSVCLAVLLLCGRRVP
ncbi:hypothetical protein KI387_035055, partial [Taxus chinensis]